MHKVWLMTALAVFGLEAAAYAGQRTDPFDGLLPKGFSAKPAARACRGTDLASGKVSIIPSKRFLGYIKTFSKRKTRGGWPGASQAANNFYVTSADPQLISDFVVDLLNRNGVASTISSDIPSSLQSGSKHFLILDFKSNYHAFGGGTYGTRDVEGGVHILDSNLAVCHSTLTHSSAPLGEGQDLKDSNDGVLVYSMGIVRAHQAFQRSIEAAMKADFFKAN